ncbi:MAG: alpha/beta fold hydrolase [Anaerolineae bacterium]|jgi:alpha/beta superfamily hydrolase|nr:alpha/beta fold hydrolase [Anaerolineae bacterium]MDH7473270.1 alpha/beta fold hydrolase [Anaerolineae bacterium]
MSDREQAVRFSSGGANPVELEGRLRLPNSDRYPAAIVCHPHPLYGGTMDNSVVVTIAQMLAARGIASLRFNFRGVGRSQGRFSGDAGETDDARGALAFLRAQRGVDQRQMYVIGYSFGAWVGLRCADDAEIAGVIAVAPPLLVLPHEGLLRDFAGRRCFIVADNDQFCPVENLLAFVATLSPPGEVKIVHGADHFLWGHEREVGELVAGFITDRGQ